MNRSLSASLFFAIAASLSCRADERADFFEKRVRPILHDHCVECHNAEKEKGGLRVDSGELLLKGGDSGPAIVVGKPDESLLLKAVRHLDKDLKMPPAKAGPKLPDAAIADLAEWVKSGAFWPPGVATIAGEKEKFNLGARKERLPWIWQTPQKQAIPEVPGSTDVDRFLSAKLLEKGLSPEPPAGDLTWLRRVYFAVTGLPPQREQMQAFLKDTSPQRREHVVDEVLASPHFGERWARHWMDVVRYAESRGHEDDYIIANAWRYRDYLIRAFNSDLPYDRFVAEHIAGDLVPPRLDAAGANESVLATGWAFLGEEVHSPVDIRQDECERVDNKVDVLSKAFLGLTVACARCHDHKFDAITQKDYYALSGFVLGSPYRQVRFATMQAHKLAATKLAEIRAAQTGKLTAAFAAAIHPGAENIAAYLMGARRVLFGEKPDAVAAATGLNSGRLTQWTELLKQAVKEPNHPLHSLTMLAHDPDAENPAKVSELIARQPSPALSLPADAQIIADFTKAEATPWKTDGPGFGTRPLSAGDVVFGTPQQPIARIMPYGTASFDRFWSKLSLTPGTEMDSGQLRAAARAGRTVLTPKVTLATGRVHYLIRGKADVYAGVDSHIMINGPLHGSLMARFDTGGKLAWVTHNLTAFSGHRAHFEFASEGDAALDVLMVVESKDTPTWQPAAVWQPKADAASLRAVAESFQSDSIATIDAIGSGKPFCAPLADWLAQNGALLGLDSAKVSAAAAELFRLQNDLAKTIRWDSPTAVSWADGSGVDEHVLIRGKPTQPGTIAARRLPEAFGLPLIDTRETNGRAELANQIIDPANPLVARVIVNRVWHHLFGRGIVPTVDNFGYLGERPSHPELLDHLAWQFVHEDTWSIKKLIRRLTLTDAFARSSRAEDAHATEVDPNNLLLHRFPVQRLEGEAIRDALLVVSGRLDPKLGGPPIPVHLTDFIVGRGRPGSSGPLDGAGRRSVYTAVRRNFLPTMMTAFDYPTPFSTVGRRNVTNVPAQTLVLMNDPFVREQAEVWAKRLQHELPGADDTARIEWLFETATTRPPKPEETRFSIESLTELRALYAGKPESVVWAEFCHALLSANDFIYLK